MADVHKKNSKTKLNKKIYPGKKRERNVEEWHKVKQRRLRVAGKEYINANGKTVSAKTPGPDCNCRRKCYEKIPEDVRLKIFQGFYAMNTLDEQNAYLFGLMRQVDVKRKKAKQSSRRTCTFEYYVRVRGRETQVCQTAFKNIHAITERKVRVLCKKMDDGVMYPCDNRGKKSHQRAGEVRLPGEIIEQVKAHIYSIVHTHRLKDFIRLDKVSGLDINISKMWKNYISTYDPEHLEHTVVKAKRTLENESVERLQVTLQQQGQGCSEIPGYPNGSLISLNDNYLAQSQTIPCGSFYPQSIVLQDALGTNHHAESYIFVSTKQESEPMHDLKKEVDLPFARIAAVNKPEIKNEKRPKGPLVKQWRYTNMFHELINGPVLVAIKTRLTSYYDESEISKKRVKKQESVQVQTQSLPDSSPHQNHTVTIYT